MVRSGRVARGGVLAFVLCLLVQAIFLLREEPPPRAPAEAAPATGVAERKAWSVRVDGWVIEVDGVTARPAWRQPPVEPRPAESPPEIALSRYDGLIGRYADEAGFDWRLVSAVIFEESGFQEEAESPAGAYGLMQVRPIAARDVGQVEFRDAESNIRTGVRYLKRLEDMFAAARGRDRLALVLAAYNMGPTHVQEAQFLARRFGYDPLVWNESMQAVLPLLEEPEFHEHLPSGYAQGSRTVQYVERVLARFDGYRRSLSAEPPGVGVLGQLTE